MCVCVGGGGLETYDGPAWRLIYTLCSVCSVCMTNAGTCRTRMGGGSTEHVYAADRGYVVVLVLGDLVTRRHFVRGLEGDA